MRLIARVLGTWLIGLALVLLVMDGTRSLGADALVLTRMGALWSQLHGQSLEALEVFVQTRFFGDLLAAALDAVLAYPAFAVCGVPGIVLAVLGRTPQRQHYLRQDQF